MHPRNQVLLFAACLALTAPAKSEEASSENAEEARSLFDHGVEHFRRGDFDAAIEDFEGALRIKPHPATLFNLGRAYASAQRSLDAVRVLKAYLADADDTLPAYRRNEASELLARQLQRLGKLVIASSQPGVSVTVDGTLVGETPLPLPISIASGNHVVLGTRPGYTPVVHTVRVAASQATELNLTLEALPRASAPLDLPKASYFPIFRRMPPPPAAVPVRTALSSDAPRLSVLGRIGVASVGVGAAAGALGTYFALRAQGSWSQRNEHCSASGCDDQAVEAWKDAKRFAFASDISFAAGLVAAAAGAYLLVAQSSGPNQPVTRLSVGKKGDAWLVQLGGQL